MDPDSAGALALAISPPLAQIGDVVGALEAIDALLPDGDGLKWFNWLYLGVTRPVGACAGSGGFHDPAFIGALDVNFAAAKSAKSKRTAPSQWDKLPRLNHLRQPTISFRR